MYNKAELQATQRYKLIRTISYIIGAIATGSALMYIALAIILPWSDLYWFSAGLAAWAVLTVIALLLNHSPLKSRVAAWYMVISQLVATAILTYLMGSDSPILFTYIWVIILAGLLSLSPRSIVAIIVMTLAVGTALMVSQQVWNLWTPVVYVGRFSWSSTAFWIFGWVAHLIAIGASIMVFANLMARAMAASQAYGEQLSQALGQLRGVTSFGATLSHDLSGVTNELSATSRQQASGSQEQVAAVTQVTASLEELNETANQIAGSADAASSSAERAVTIANEVKNASELAEATATKGNEAVELTVASVERVRNRIELLGQRLLNLTEQTRRVGTIIDLIDEIADETHLLALNASIEAAGGIISEDDGGSAKNSSRGERFGVIAQEVKNLADRSREATEEVREAITEMQGAVAAAVLVAEEGKKDTAAALARSEISGQMIDNLNEVIVNSASRATQILLAVEEVKVRCDEISLATGQQRSANQQILMTMRGVAQVSQESAGAVVLLSETVSHVCRKVDELNNVLGKSGLQIPVMAAA
jgi:methyl-accepting chemotaxis protein